MNKTLQVRMDEQIKTDADTLFESLGLDTSTAVRMFLRAALNKGGFPFVVAHEAFEELRPEYQQAVDDARQGKNLAGPFKAAEEAVNAMLEGCCADD